MRFDGRVALVTGAGRGMGRAHALLLAARGARVLVCDVGSDLHGGGADPDPAAAVAAEVCAAGGEAIAYAGDLTDETAARDAVRLAITQWGRLDILVHNAGFTLGSMPFEQETLVRLDRLLAINTRAAFALAQEAWPILQAQRFGRVVLAGSGALYGMARSIPYSAAKSSYLGLARGLAAEGEARGILVNLIAPQGATRMAENMPDSSFRTWFLETMRPELVSPLVAYLAHETCMVNGETFVVGGGRIARLLLAESHGYVDPAMTPEDVRSHMPAILKDATTYPVEPGEPVVKYAALALGFDMSNPIAVAAKAAG